MIHDLEGTQFVFTGEEYFIPFSFFHLVTHTRRLLKSISKHRSREISPNILFLPIIISTNII